MPVIEPCALLMEILLLPRLFFRFSPWLASRQMTSSLLERRGFFFCEILLVIQKDMYDVPINRGVLL